MGVVVWYSRKIAELVFAAKIMIFKTACQFLPTNLIVISFGQGQRRNHGWGVRIIRVRVSNNSTFTWMMTLHVILISLASPYSSHSGWLCKFPIK
jgi:hypothetical protein